MRDVSQVRCHDFNFQWTKIILSEPVNLGSWVFRWFPGSSTEWELTDIVWKCNWWLLTR